MKILAVLLFSAAMYGQTNIATPGNVLPKADGSDFGQICWLFPPGAPQTAADCLKGIANGLAVYDSLGVALVQFLGTNSGAKPFIALQGTARLGLGTDVFANLGSEGNSRILYCSDCKASNPCVGGGSGAVAARVNGAWSCGVTVPANAIALASDSAGNIIAAALQGTGPKVQAAAGTTTTGDTTKYDASGNLIDAGFAPANQPPASQVALASNGASPPAIIGATMQGNGAKVQASTGSTTTNDIVKYDAAGNAIDSGIPIGSISALPTGMQTQFLQIQPNAGNNTTLNFVSPIYLAARDYNFPAQTPGGTLTATTPATVTLAPCPNGVNGSDSQHWLYIVGGINEAVLITGGSCTSGAASGTVVFTPGQNHVSTWTIGSSTAGIQEAYQSLKTAAVPGKVTCSGAITTFGPVVVQANNIEIDGDGCVWSLNFAAGTSFGGLNFLGVASGASTTSATNLLLTNRSTTAVKTIAFTSTSGFAVGNLVLMQYNDGTYIFQMYNPITEISGSNVTFAHPVIIPLQSGSSPLTGITPLVNVGARNIRFDCTPSSASVTFIRGMFVQHVSASAFRNLSFNGCQQSSQATGLYDNGSHSSTYDGIFALNSGSANVNAIAIFTTAGKISNITSIGNPDLSLSSGAFGLGFAWCTLTQFDNIYSSGNYSRQIKFAFSGWNNITNITGNNSVHATGLAVTLGSYRNKFTNVTTLNNQSDVGNGQGVWMDGTDNEYNEFHNVVSLGNTGAAIFFTGTDANNLFQSVTLDKYPNGNTGGGQTDSGGGNRIELNGSTGTIGILGCTGTFTSSATIYLLPATNAACTNTGSPLQGISFASPTTGIIRNLRVSAGVGGVNSSSGVVSVLIVGTGVTGLTCTLGVGTTCQDLTHYYVIPAGTLFQVNVTTQGGETLSNVVVTLEY